ncbi:MAG: hypothetical protein LCI00_05185 [Chloroflexi bacterium]|nr:hypothetical protein [Chloroflexota bacterium]
MQIKHNSHSMAWSLSSRPTLQRLCVGSCSTCS